MAKLYENKRMAKAVYRMGFGVFIGGFFCR